MLWTFSAALGGAPIPWKKAPSFSPFSFVSGGYLRFVVSSLGLVESAYKIMERIDLPRDVGRLPIEEIWHKHLVFMLLITCCKDIGALERLREVTKDIKDEQNGGSSRRRASHISNSCVSRFSTREGIYQSMLTGLHAINGLVLSLGLVTLGDDGRNIATGFGVAVLRLHLLS